MATTTRHWALVAAFALVCSALVGGVIAAPADAAYPGTNGLIAYDREGEIWTIEPDGSYPTQLTVPFLATHATPAWSAPGNQVVFRWHPSGISHQDDIFVVDADGTNYRNLTDTAGVIESNPAWSPDGRLIAYERENAIWAMHSNGNAQSPLIASDPNSDHHQPAWSPNGKWIAFVDNPHVGYPDVAIVDEYGDNYRNLTNTPGISDGNPTWSPDGTKIAYEREQAIWVMNADGTDQHPLTVPLLSVHSAPAWSPDGTQVAFRWHPTIGSHQDDIWVVNADGTNYVNLTNTAGITEGNPDWQPGQLGPDHTTGLVDPATGEWHLRDVRGVWSSFYFGVPGDYPIMGDWDCDGIETPGLYRQSDGYAYLRNSNSTGVADLRFYFGIPGDIPLAGDFDGDGCDTVSIYRPSQGRVFISNQLGENEGAFVADFDYYFGNPGDKPFCGDFNGNGVETIGLHRESSGLVYFRQTHTQGFADDQFYYGNPGDRLISGDWGIVDGVFTMGIYRPSNQTTYLRYFNSLGIADLEYYHGEPDWLPIAGCTSDSCWLVK